MAKARPVVKAAALDKTINASTDALNKACAEADKSVAKVAADVKKLRAECKRHMKKKSTLTKRSKTASDKYKKSPDAASKKAVAAVTKELKATVTALGKARATKAVQLVELDSIKKSSKRLTAYTKGIAAADKVLNKPTKNRRKAKK
jgi:hypothetical protein